jgi:hypothetical protein
MTAVDELQYRSGLDALALVLSNDRWKCSRSGPGSNNYSPSAPAPIPASASQQWQRPGTGHRYQATKRAIDRLFREGKKKDERIEQVQVQLTRLGPIIVQPTTSSSAEQR